MRLSKKVSLSVLSTTLLLANLGVTNWQNLVKPNVVLANNNEQLSNVSKEQDNNFGDNDKVIVIVKLKEDQVDPDKLTTKEGREEREEQTKPEREKALEKIDDAGIDYKKLYDYDLLFNGFALETTYKEAKKIQSLDVVDSVELNVQYDKPVSTGKNSEDVRDGNYGKAIDSNNLIDVQPLWDKGIKGQGRVVSVIDSGIDPDHDILRITDVSKARYQNDSQMEEAKKKAGIDYGRWYSEKLVFAFNYNDWNDDIKEGKEDSHGMHVAGSAVGNPSKPTHGGQYVAGVAPEAQLMFMRVFSDTKGNGTTSSYIYIKAIEDSVKLGADTINMSLGSTTGSVSEVGKAVSEAILLAKKAGVTVAIAAGNANTFGKGYNRPNASNPDYGLVGNPSVSSDSISVAALSNSVLSADALEVKELSGDSEFNSGLGAIKTYATHFEENKDYKYVFANLGKEEDFKDKDLNGKVALIKRGEITFVEKVKNAKAAGAIGVVIFNHESGGEDILSMALEDLDKDFPIVSMGNKLGTKLSSSDYTLAFGKYVKNVNPNEGSLTDFTSWGMSTDGELKPDVTAPGGDILSSFNNGTYGLNSGTSMASPHVAGAVTLVKQSLLQRFPNLDGEEMQKLVKHLVMSTAVPNVNKITNALTSPRQQGAGVVDTYKAALGDLYVTGDNDYGSISLGNVADSFTFNVTLHNISDQDKELVYTTYLTTDEVDNGSITLNPKALSEVSGGKKLVVPAKGQLTIPITVDASRFKSELQGLMPNGYYLEGFVKFFNASNDEELVSIPYVGFRGDFQDLPVMEKPIYDFTGKEKPFYYYKEALVEDEDKERDTDNNFTALMTVTNNNEDVVVLGEYEDYKTKENYFGKLAFSPNGDRNYDEIELKAVFLRNYENLKLSVYAKDDKERSNPLYENGNESGTKNYYDGNPENPKSKFLASTSWVGKDKDGKDLPDGEYQYVVSYYPAVAGAKKQETSFNVVIDRVAPKIEGTGGTYDEKTRTFTPYAVKEEGSGILYKRLAYKVKEKQEDKEVEVEKYVDVNKDGSYTLPEGVELEKFVYQVADFAGNKDEVTLSTVQNEEKGTIEVKLTSESKLANYASSGRYKITNEKGELVGEDFIKNNKTLRALTPGKYKVELVLFDEDLQLLSPKTVEVEITKENLTKEVEFTFKELESNAFEIKFDKELPDGAEVYVVNERGEKTLLPKSKYNAKSYQKKLINGKYTVEITLPEDYKVSENKFDYEIVNGHNVKNLTLTKLEKVATLATDSSSENKGTVTFESPAVYANSKFVVETLAEDKTQGLEEKVAKQLDDVSKYSAVFLDLHLERDGKEFSVQDKKTVELDTNVKNAKVYAERDGELVVVESELKDGKLKFETDSLGNFVVVTEKEQSETEKPKEETNEDKVTSEKPKEESNEGKVTPEKPKEDKVTPDNKPQDKEQDASENPNNDSKDQNNNGNKDNDSSKENEERPNINKDTLLDELKDRDSVASSDKYVYDTLEARGNYEKAIFLGQKVYRDSSASQDEVDKAVKDILDAKNKLAGVKPEQQHKDNKEDTSGKKEEESNENANASSDAKLPKQDNDNSDENNNASNPNQNTKLAKLAKGNLGSGKSNEGAKKTTDKGALLAKTGLVAMSTTLFAMLLIIIAFVLRKNKSK